MLYKIFFVAICFLLTGCMTKNSLLVAKICVDKELSQNNIETFINYSEKPFPITPLVYIAHNSDKKIFIKILGRENDSIRLFKIKIHDKDYLLPDSFYDQEFTSDWSNWYRFEGDDNYLSKYSYPQIKFQIISFDAYMNTVKQNITKLETTGCF